MWLLTVAFGWNLRKWIGRNLLHDEAVNTNLSTPATKTNQNSNFQNKNQSNYEKKKILGL